MSGRDPGAGARAFRVFKFLFCIYLTLILLIIIRVAAYNFNNFGLIE